jgi:hypothetical protein
MGRMLKVVAVSIVTWMLTLMAHAGGAEPDAAQYPQYDLRVEIVPKDHSLRVEGAIKGLADLDHPTLYLNQGFSIERLRANGRPADYVFALDEPAPKWVSVARPIHIRADAVRSVEFAYHGTLPARISDVNQIDTSLVELAIYAGWYPFSPAFTKFSSQVVAALPREFLVVGDGELQHASRRHDTLESTFHAAGSSDIVLVASPDFRRFSVRRQQLRIELIAAGMERRQAGAILQRLSGGLQELIASYGAPPEAGSVRFVISPRAGWGYSRRPLFVISGESRVKELAGPYGLAEDFHGQLHELAHFWWSVADPSGPDDWLNEGLAEYSAVLVSAHMFGPGYRDFVITGFHGDISRGRTQESILTTGQDSVDRYINMYEKPVLLFQQLSTRFGEDKVVTFLKRFYSQSRDSKAASTRGLLDAARQELGEEAEEYMVRCLSAPGWTGESGAGW